MARPWARPWVRRAGALAIAVAVGPFLPLYVRRSMMRSFRSEGGDSISWRWDFSTLPRFIGDMRTMRPEESKHLYLAFNLGLCALWIALLAFALAAAWSRLARERPA
ncbi:MAG: hypothetical protein WKG00_36270 [Polyangiaceae bacterium]